MEITVLKKTTIGRTWGWDREEGGHRLMLALLALVCFSSLFFLPPFLRHHKSTGNSSWTKQHFYWVASPSTVSYSNLFWISMSILLRKLDIFFLSLIWWAFLTLVSWRRNEVLGEFVTGLTNGRLMADILVLIWNRHGRHYSLAVLPRWRLNVSNLRTLFIVATQIQHGRCLYPVPPTE